MNLLKDVEIGIRGNPTSSKKSARTLNEFYGPKWLLGGPDSGRHRAGLMIVARLSASNLKDKSFGVVNTGTPKRGRDSKHMILYFRFVLD
jgi:hypothetical protein